MDSEIWAFISGVCVASAGFAATINDMPLLGLLIVAAGSYGAVIVIKSNKDKAEKLLEKYQNERRLW